MTISLHYGQELICLQIPKDNIAQLVSPRQSVSSSQSGTAVLKPAFNKSASAFTELIKGKILGVLLPDGTRDLPPQDIFDGIFGLFATTQKVLFFICTGTHNADTPRNQVIIDCIRAQCQQNGIYNIDIIVHDCRQSDFLSAGTTQRGTAILYNARLQEPSVFLVLSDVKPHYFAGYSNPVKYFVPGLCAFQTVEQNHSWTMKDASRAGVHPWHPDPAARDNPLAQDQLEGMTKILQDRQVWALVTLSTEGRIQWADFGPAQNVTLRAFLKTDTDNCFTAAPAQKMIVSPGGLPNDVDLYIAQRALELTASVVPDGGEILFLAACPDGVGSPRTKSQFYDKLICPIEQISAAAQNDYRLFSHKPWRFARLIRRLNKLWLHSHIAPDEIEKMHMASCSNPQRLINRWLHQNPREQILIIDGANKVLVRPKT